jgi:23S rRNA A2030 N6-methylase RlmJ
MTKRIKYIVFISASKFPYKMVVNALGTKISRRYAGVSFSNMTGAWSQEGAEFKESYGQIHIEEGLKIELIVMPEDQKTTLSFLRSALIETKAELKLDIHWVHVETSECQAEHFLLNE